MAGYATLADVNAYAAKRTFGATSIPSASQVAKFLVDTSAEIDGILAGDGYALPIPTTATVSLAYLNRLTSIGAWSKVEHAAQTSQDGGKAAQKAWDDARSELVRGITQLADSPRLGGEAFARSVSAPTPFFTRDMKLRVRAWNAEGARDETRRRPLPPPPRF